MEVFLYSENLVLHIIMVIFLGKSFFFSLNWCFAAQLGAQGTCSQLEVGRMLPPTC